MTRCYIRTMRIRCYPLPSRRLLVYRILDFYCAQLMELQCREILPTASVEALQSGIQAWSQRVGRLDMESLSRCQVSLMVLANTIFLSERLVGNEDSGDLHRNPIGLTGFPSMLTGYAVEDWVAFAERIGAITIPLTETGGKDWKLGDKLFYSHATTPNSPVIDFNVQNYKPILGIAAARSLHVQGVNVLRGDGSVTFVSESVDSTTYQALATISGSD